MNPTKKCFLVCALALCATPVFAGTLATDTNAIAGWHSSTPFDNTVGVAGDVDWAVYAPGTFPAGFLGYTPSVGEYVYAYQVFEGGTVTVSQLTVLLSGPTSTIGTFSGLGVSGVVPLSQSIDPFVSADWIFDSIGLLPGQSSTGLVFSSPNSPISSAAIVFDHGTYAVVLPVPSPGEVNIPEPGTLTLALFGFVGFAFAWLRRRIR